MESLGHLAHLSLEIPDKHEDCSGRFAPSKL
jgi:hypothetical protein